MPYLSQQEGDTALEVLDQYSLTPAQLNQAKEELNRRARGIPFNAYHEAHAIAAKIEREANNDYRTVPGDSHLLRRTEPVRGRTNGYS